MSFQEGIECRYRLFRGGRQEGFFEFQVNGESGGGLRVHILDQHGRRRISGKADQCGIVNGGFPVRSFQIRSGLLEKALGEGVITSFKCDPGVEKCGLTPDLRRSCGNSQCLENFKSGGIIPRCQFPPGEGHQAPRSERMTGCDHPYAPQEEIRLLPRALRIHPVESGRPGIERVDSENRNLRWRWRPPHCRVGCFPVKVFESGGRRAGQPR